MEALKKPELTKDKMFAFLCRVEMELSELMQDLNLLYLMLDNVHELDIFLDEVEDAHKNDEVMKQQIQARRADLSVFVKAGALLAEKYHFELSHITDLIREKITSLEQKIKERNLS